MTSEVRVLHVINGLGTGGAERSLAEMAPLLAAEGVDLRLACLFRRDEGVQESIVASGVHVWFVEAKTFRRRIQELRSLLHREQPDLVHTTLFESDVAGRLASRGQGVPVLSSIVNTSYDPVRLQDPNVAGWKLAAGRLVDAWTARRYTDHFHALTEAVKQAAVRSLRIAPGDVTVIPRGRDLERLGAPSALRRDQVRRSLGIANGAPLLVTAGRQEFQKGHGYLLRAVAHLRASYPSLSVLVAGRRGNETPELQALHRHLGLDETVRLLGHRDDVPDLLAAADVFVFPSLYEGLGGAVIEAMALGLPIVASDLPALREVVEPDGNAILVSPGEPAALAAAIRQLLDSPETRDRFGTRSREIFEGRFTLDRSVTAMAELYRAVSRAGSDRRKARVL